MAIWGGFLRLKNKSHAKSDLELRYPQLSSLYIKNYSFIIVSDVEEPLSANDYLCHRLRNQLINIYNISIYKSAKTMRKE